MRLLLIVLGAFIGVVVLLIVLVIAVGYQLEPRHTASRSRLIKKPADEIYDAIRDVTRYPDWRPDVKSVELLSTDTSGRTRFRESGSDGAVTYEITEEQPGRSMVTTIVDKDLGYSGSWSYALEPQPSGTQITITEDAEVTNPFFRFMSKYVFGYSSGLEKYLEALDRKS